MRDVHKKLMSVSQPGMEIYGILAEDFWPLIKSNPELYEEFTSRSVNEDVPDGFVVLYAKSDAFKFVDGLLNDGDHRIQSLAGRDDFLQSQQHISDVCSEMILFGDSHVQNRAESKMTKRTRGRPKKTEFKGGYIYAGNATVHIRGNRPVTRLCEKMFSLPIDKSIHWTDLYEYIYEMHNAPRGGWRRLSAIIQRVNDKMKEANIDRIFIFEGVASGEVRRLY